MTGDPPQCSVARVSLRPAARRPFRRLVSWALLAGSLAAGWVTGAYLFVPGPDAPDRADRPVHSYTDEERTALAARTAAAWDRIERQLKAKAPQVLDGLNGPAEPTELDRIERRTGRPLPPDVRASWLRHDGQARGCQLGGARLLPTEVMHVRQDWWGEQWETEFVRSDIADVWDVGRLSRDAVSHPAAPLDLATPRWMATTDELRRQYAADRDELIVDLRVGELLEHGDRIGCRTYPSDGRALSWADRLEAIAERLESLKAGDPAFGAGDPKAAWDAAQAWEFR